MVTTMAPFIAAMSPLHHQPIGTSMSLVSGLILGEAAVGAGIASRITIVVVALSAVCYFLIPKLYGAVSIWSIGIVILAALFGIPGVILISVVLLSPLVFEFRLDSCQEEKLRHQSSRNS